MKRVEWGEYKIDELFSAQTGDTDLQQKDCNGLGEYLVNSGLDNCGVKGRTDRQAKIFPANTITIDFWGNAFYRDFEYKMATHNHVFSLSGDIIKNRRVGIFLANQFFYMRKVFSYNYMGTWNKIKDMSIFLPIKDNKIDFDFMEDFVAELEAYLEATGLKEYKLTKKEECLLRGGNSAPRIQWQEFVFREIFDNIKQGRRLKKEDQISGKIPFVMSGTTNNGVANYVSNPVASFPKNSITIDIFGNTFYRNYDFGAGDDTGVYWSSQDRYSLKMMLFLTTSMKQAVANKFSYGHKLRSSQSLDFKMWLPVKNGQPDYEYMESYISAIQKLIIADVVRYADDKIAATKQIVNQ